jgi:hypothetical protein
MSTSLLFSLYSLAIGTRCEPSLIGHHSISSRESCSGEVPFPLFALQENDWQSFYTHQNLDLEWMTASHTYSEVNLNNAPSPILTR